MDGFIKCPQCEELDARRMECTSCGYRVPTASPASESTASKFESWRLLGLVMIPVGAIIVAALLGWPVYQASRNVTEITIHKYPIMLGALLTLTGINVAIFGERAFDWLPNHDSDITAIQLIVLAVNVAIVTAGFMWFDGYIEGIGYTLENRPSKFPSTMSR